MATALLQRVAVAALLALPVALGLAVFVEKCGAIHGPPDCGALSYAAIPFLVISLALESLLFVSPQNDHVVHVILWFVAFVVAILLCLVILRLRSFARRR
jgi:heme A synthase